jgi:predicted transcriptional regulator
VVTPEGIAAVEAIVKENRRVTVNEIAAHLDISHGSAHRIVCDVLQLYKYLINYSPIKVFI